MAQGFTIRTPTDFEATIGAAGSYVKAPLVSPAADVEPAFRSALNGIFEDLQYVDPGDAEGVASFLDGIEAPLNDLHDLGFTLFAIGTRGTLTLPDGALGPPSQRRIPWTRTYYLVVPVGGFFRIGEDAGETVHRFKPDCEAVVESLARAAQDKSSIAVWYSAEDVRQSLERRVPWCQRCCLDLGIRG